jgi:AmmeMemoRadiSam system protein A
MLTGEERESLIALARASVESAVGARPAPHRSDLLAGITQRSGAFVTLRVGGELRGCIGAITADEALPDVVAEMAVKAALEDPRFPPVSVAELPKLSYEVSVLSPLELVAGPEEIVVGTHGVLIESARHRGLLLPQVALEYGWTTLEFLAHTCRKAGLPPDAWKRKETRIFVFSAELIREEHPIA